MTQACPYCQKEVEPRGRKNHVRLSSGGGHGEKGDVPDSYENDVQGGVDGEEADSSTGDGDKTETPSDAADGDTSESSEPAEVTAESLGDTEADSAAGGGEEYGRITSVSPPSN